NLFVTGFDTARLARPGDEIEPSLLKALGRFSKDARLVALDARSDAGTFDPTVDVFAIGTLLAELRRLPTGSMDVLSARHWDDPWHCFAYHCLAADANIRFQSAEQILMFLREWPPGESARTVA